MIIILFLKTQGIVDFANAYHSYSKRSKKSKNAEKPGCSPELSEHGLLIHLKDRENLYLELEDHFKEIKPSYREHER